MARMKLHKSTRFGDNEVYPIYEIDFSGLSSTGYVQEESNDAVGSQAYKYRQWKTINNNIGLYIPRDIPKQETQEGNIIPFWHRYNNLVDGRYMLSQENLESFAAVEQGIKPEDWGTNPNYCEFIRESISSPVNLDILRPYLNRTISTWSGSISYYEDTKRSELRMFYTDTGCSFAVTKTSYSRGDGYIWPRTYSIGLYPHNSQSLRFPAHYAYTDPNDNVIDKSYYINDTVSVINPNTGYGDRSMYTDGYNCQMVFVHYVQDGTDFYGVAIIQMNNFTEQSEPVAIHVSAWDSTFWGTSIIAGGGGSGSWTNDGPTSYVQGGQGKFRTPSDNFDDPWGDEYKKKIDDPQTGWNHKMQFLNSNQHFYAMDTEHLDDIAGFINMRQNMWGSSDLWTSLKYSSVKPWELITTCHLIPRQLGPAVLRDSNSKSYIVITEPGAWTSSAPAPPQLNISGDVKVPTFEETQSWYHVGHINLESQSDSFADYTNTSVYIYLPYVGTFQIDTAAVMEGELSVNYLTDVYTGDITAFIWTKDRFGQCNYRYMFKGNCAMEIPLYGRVDPATKALSAAIGTGIGAIGNSVNSIGNIFSSTASGLMSGGITGGVKGLSEGVHNFNQTGITNATNIAQSAYNAYMSGQSLMQCQTGGGKVTSLVPTQCMLIIQRPMWSAPEEYGKLIGYPSDIGGTINQSDTEAGDPFTDFLSVRSIKLDGLTATEKEKGEILSLMMSGVYVS